MTFIIIGLIVWFHGALIYFAAIHLKKTVSRRYSESLSIEGKRARLVAAEASLRAAADKAVCFYYGDVVEAAESYRSALATVIRHEQQCDEATAAKAAECAARSTVWEIRNGFNARIEAEREAEKKAKELEFFRVRSIARNYTN
jgi:hypothetical protein